MVLRDKLPQLQDAAIATYDYVDLVNGLGYNNFFLLISETGGASPTQAFRMSPTQEISAQSDYGLGNGSEINFDTSTFNATRTVKGNLFITGSFEPDTNAAPASILFRLLKVGTNGTTETAISSQIETQDANVDNTHEMMHVIIPLTETIIGVGEKLRLEVIGTAAASNVYIGTDPLDGDGTEILPASTTATTVTKIGVPFRIYN